MEDNSGCGHHIGSIQNEDLKIGRSRVFSCQQLASPKGAANAMELLNPTPPQTNSSSGSGGDSNNRFAVPHEEDNSDATTDVVPTDGIVEANQEGPVAMQASSNEAAGDVQGQVAKPEVEGGIAPQERGSSTGWSCFVQGCELSQGQIRARSSFNLKANDSFEDAEGALETQKVSSPLPVFMHVQHRVGGDK